MTEPTHDVDDQADAPTPDDEPDERAASWGPTWGPETGHDTARPTSPARRPASVAKRRGWHPPGGPF